jgi:hypothetical protein
MKIKDALYGRDVVNDKTVSAGNMSIHDSKGLAGC